MRGYFHALIAGSLLLGTAMLVGCEKKSDSDSGNQTTATPSATDKAKEVGAEVKDATTQAVDKTKEAASKAVQATKDAAGKVENSADQLLQKTKDVNK